MTEEVAKLGMEWKTKVAAKLGTESVEKVMEKADMAALQFCKKQNIATGSRSSTELKKRSTCQGINGGNCGGNLRVELRDQ